MPDVLRYPWPVTAAQKNSSECPKAINANYVWDRRGVRSRGWVQDSLLWHGEVSNWNFRICVIAVHFGNIFGLWIVNHHTVVGLTKFCIHLVCFGSSEAEVKSAKSYMWSFACCPLLLHGPYDLYCLLQWIGLITRCSLENHCFVFVVAHDQMLLMTSLIWFISDRVNSRIMVTIYHCYESSAEQCSISFFGSAHVP